jgi:hypothetical protein
MARFLADESCDAAVVLALRKAGYDLVFAVTSLLSSWNLSKSTASL